MTLSTILAGALLAAAPQSPSGIFANVPVLLTNSNREEVHTVGGAAEPAQLASLYNPLFAAHQLFGATGLKISSFSTGRSFVTLDIRDVAGTNRACADLSANNGSWSFILYSVGPNTISGLPGQAGSPYQMAGAPVYGDVFARVLEGSEEYIPDLQVGDIRWARLGADMGVTDVHGLDSYGYASLMNPSVENPVEIYFTVDTGVSTFPMNGRWGGLSFADFTSNNIFKVSWESTGWGDVSVYKYGAELGLTVGDQIDALTVDAERKVVLYSLKGASLLNQLRIYSNRDGEAIHNGPYYNAAGTFPYADVYLLLREGDEIDGACVDDPVAPEHATDTGTRHQWRQRVMQLPLITFPEPTPPSDIIDCSGFRIARLGSIDKYFFYIRNSFQENISAVVRVRMGGVIDPAVDPIVSGVYRLIPGQSGRFVTNYTIFHTGQTPVENPVYYWQVIVPSLGAQGRLTSWPFQLLR